LRPFYTLCQELSKSIRRVSRDEAEVGTNFQVESISASIRQLANYDGLLIYDATV